jgi:hypothetical protein
MDKEIYQQYCDKLFQTKNREQWDSVCTEIKEATENDEQARTALRNYLSKIKDKKFEYFEKYNKLNENKRVYPQKITYLLQEDLAKTLNEYLTLLVIEKKKQLGL